MLRDDGIGTGAGSFAEPEPVPAPATVPHTLSAGPKVKTAKRKLFEWHSWFGFQLTLLFSLVLITGTLATVSHEIDWLISPNYRANASAEAPAWTAIHEAALAHNPDDGLWWIALGPQPHLAATAVKVRADGTRYNLRLEAATGAVKGEDPWLNAQRFLRDLHRYLFMPSATGLPIVSAFAFLLVFQLYSGLKTTKKWRVAATRLRFNRGARVAVGDAHKAAGLWVSWFLLLMAVTGIWYLAEFLMQANDYPSEVEHQPVYTEIVERHDAVIPQLPLGTYASVATEAFEGLEPRTVRFPFKPGEPVVVEGFTGDPLVRERANEVWLDPATAKVLKVQRSAQMNALNYMTEIADPLHFGTLGGLATKLLWFIAGLGLSGLALTGTWLTWKRLRRGSPTVAQWATMPVLLAVCFLGYGYVRSLSLGNAYENSVALPGQTVSGLRLAPTVETDAQGAPTGRVRITARSANGTINLGTATLSLCGDAADAKIETAGQVSFIRAELPTQGAHRCHLLELVATTGSGRELRQSWVLARS
ncbi:PepSY-associated TM helix domain-containing protein [Sphingomonas sp.]